jgi:hypothetical protein
MWKTYVFSVIGMLLWGAGVLAQEDGAPVISAENIGQLQPVYSVDFAELGEQGYEMLSGRFVVSADGETLLLNDVLNRSLVVDVRGEVLAVYPEWDDMADSLTFLAGAFAYDDPAVSLSLYTDGESHYLSQWDRKGEAGDQVELPPRIEDIWTTEGMAWAAASDGVYAWHPAENALEETPLTSFTQDAESVVRVGRIDPPFAVTATMEGLVKRWDMLTGDVTASLQAEAVPIYGYLTPDGRYLVWRDAPSSAIYISDFETGETRIGVRLDGLYFPFIFITPKADVIIGIDPDNRPEIMAWDVATGQRYDLGPYRACERALDMARLSRDGTTLVIGCESGIDIWRVPALIES